ncbi:MAG TPA: hypothetical protein VII08_09240 [Myxococcales bacterium]
MKSLLYEEEGWPGVQSASHAAYLRPHRSHQKKLRGNRGRSCLWYSSPLRHTRQRSWPAWSGSGD